MARPSRVVDHSGGTATHGPLHCTAVSMTDYSCSSYSLVDCLSSHVAHPAIERHTTDTATVTWAGLQRLASSIGCQGVVYK